MILYTYLYGIYEMSENILNEKTMVPLSLLIAVGGGVLTVGAFVTAVWYKEVANAESIAVVEKQQNQIKDDITKRLDRIEAKVDRLIERQQ